MDEGDIISGEVAFKLYDTYGFPIDLTQDIARGQGLSVGLEDFDKSMEKQREAARQSWSGSGEEVTDEVWFDVRENIGATEFLGYDTVMAEGIILAIVVGGKIVEYANIGDSVALVLNQTPFYAESGGQIGDTGSLCTNKGSKVEIIDTQKKLGELHVHFGTILQEQLKVGDIAELNVNIDRRDRLRANHSATHLLHQALRNQLGEHVTQKGSLVAPDRLRFDISQPTPISKEDLTAVEDIVNQRILLNSKVDTLILTPEKAIEAGALALFGEKYGDEVRVVSMGGLVGSGTNEINRKFSVELCGGTHVSQTGDIGLFKIISEGGVSAGVRRIEALTGIEARRHLGEQSNLLTETADILKTSQQNVPVRVAQLIEERRKLERDLADARRKIATGGAVDQDTRGADIGGITFVGRSLKDVPPRELKALVDDIKVKIGSGIVAVTDIYDDKGSIVVGVTADLVKRFSAIDLVRIGVAEIGGKGGGGRSDMAQGGGPNAEKADEALKAIESEIKEQLSK